MGVMRRFRDLDNRVLGPPRYMTGMERKDALVLIATIVLGGILGDAVEGPWNLLVVVPALSILVLLAWRHRKRSLAQRGEGQPPGSS